MVAQRAAGKGVISGVVLDSASGKALREASVSLLAARDSSYVTFTITGGEGQFALRGLAPGHYQLLITFLGYESRRRAVRLTAESPTVTVGPLRLAPLTNELGEAAVVHERAPVSVSGDTLAFNARAFRTQPNAAAEALLKKLPGVEVDRDGTIRAQGQTVSRVLVDGKPFFGDDPRMATRNLPADIIDQVQLYDQQSDQQAFAGVDDGNRQRAINFVTRRDKRKGYFGPNSVGVGTAGRYAGRVSLNRFNNGRQISILGFANNANQRDFSDNGGLPTADNFGGFGGGAGVFDRGNGGGLGGPLVRVADGPDAAPPTSITASGGAGANYRDAWGSHTEVATSYLATRETEDTRQQRRRDNLTTRTDGAAPLTTTSGTDQREGTTGHRFNLRLDQALDSLTTLRLTPALAWQRTGQQRTANQQAATGGLRRTAGLTQYDATATNLASVGNALLLRRFKRAGRTFSANLTHQLNTPGGAATNRAQTTFYDPDSTRTFDLNQRTATDRTAQSLALTTSYTEPISLRSKVQVQAAVTDSRTRASREVADRDEATGRYDLTNARLSNRFRSTYRAYRGGLTWQTRRLRLGYGVGVDVQRTALDVVNRSADTTVGRAFTRLLPNALLSWSGARNRTLRVNYRTRVNAPAAEQLQPVADVTNPLLVRVGNPALRPEYGHAVAAVFNQFNLTSNRSVFGVLNGVLVQDRIVAATTVAPSGAQATRPVNANGYRSVSGFLSVGQRLPGTIKLNVSATTSAALTRSPSRVNDQLNVAHTRSVSQGLRGTSAYDDRMELGLSLNVGWQQARYSLPAVPITTVWTRTLTADVYYQLPARLVVSTDLWYQATAGGAGASQQVALWNVALARQFFRNRQGELKLQVFDVLKQNRGFERNLTDTYVETVRSRVLTRYVLVSFSYQLRQFGV